MDAAAFSSLLRRRAWLVALAALLAGGVAYFVSSEQAPTYRATATALLVPSQQASGQVLGQDQLTQLSSTYTKVAQTKAVIRLAERAQRGGRRRSTIEDALTVESAEPGLLEFAARARTRTAAARNANAYADAFRRYVDDLLQQQRQQSLLTIRTRVASLQRRLAGTTGVQRAGTQAELESLQAKAADVAATPGDSVRIIEPATAPANPDEPQPLRNAIVAFLAALAVALAVLYVRFTSSGRYASGEEVAADLKLPLLGHVPRSSTQRPASVESFNALRTRVLHSLAGAQTSDIPGGASAGNGRPNGQTLLITAAERGVGKSHVAVNLSRSIAISGLTVVAVDGDLRHAELSDRFDVAARPGLADAARAEGLGGGWQVEAVANVGGMLYAISAGLQADDPVAALASPRTEQALVRLRDEYDVTVIDTPPVLGVADTIVLSRVADGVALVVDVQHSRRRAVRRAVAVLREIDAPLLGVILNGVDPDAPYGYPLRRPWGAGFGPLGALAVASVVMCLAAVAIVLLGIVDIAGR
jgi:polysaccharide biosynthesis transport protein